MKPGWQRATKAKPCPVCKRPNGEHVSCWCIQTADGAAAICPFTESRNRTEGGYLHFLKDRTEGRAVAHHEEQIPKRINWTALQKNYVAGLNGGLRERTESLGVSEASLQRLGAGWDGEALTFPMVNALGHIQGIRRRFPDGKKKSVTGGREGVFIPTGQSLHEGPVFVCEGPTDCAALLDLGFIAIGRPSCLGAERFTIQYVGKRVCIIFADNDKAGMGGAKSLQRKIPHAKIVTPPEGVKDVRQWKINGCTTADVRKLIS